MGIDRSDNLILSDKDKEYLILMREAVAACQEDVIIKDSVFYDDEVLLIALRCRDYNIKSAFDRVKRISYARCIKYPESLAKFYPSRLEHVLRLEGKGVLKSRDHQGRHVLFTRAKIWDPDTISIEEFLLGLLMIGFEMSRFQETQKNGMVIILDVEGFNLKQAKQITPNVCRKYIELILSTSPMKYKAIHLVNISSLFEIPFKLIKMFFPIKLRQRLHSHGSSMESLHKHISPEILPSYLGGCLTEAEAVDQHFIENILSPKREKYYTRSVKKDNKQMSSCTIN